MPTAPKEAHSLRGQHLQALIAEFCEIDVHAKLLAPKLYRDKRGLGRLVEEFGIDLVGDIVKDRLYDALTGTSECGKVVT